MYIRAVEFLSHVSESLDYKAVILHYLIDSDRPMTCVMYTRHRLTFSCTCDDRPSLLIAAVYIAQKNNKKLILIRIKSIKPILPSNCYTEEMPFSMY